MPTLSVLFIAAVVLLRWEQRSFAVVSSESYTGGMSKQHVLCICLMHMACPMKRADKKNLSFTSGQ